MMEKLKKILKKIEKVFWGKWLLKYHPDRLDKNTKEEMEKYLIINELVKKLNSLFLQYK